MELIRGFQVFSRGLIVIIMIGLMLGAIEKMTGIKLVEGTNPITNGFLIVGSVTLTLAGTIPFVWFLTKVASRPLEKAGRLIGVNGITVTCMLISLSSVVPAFVSFKDMNVRGKVVMGAFAASMSNILGAHLAFAAATNERYILPMFLAKVVAGILAIIVSYFFTNRLFARELEEEKALQAAD